MTDTSIKHLFVLFWTSDRSPDGKCSVRLVKFPNSAVVAGLLPAREFKLPERIYFVANLETLGNVPQQLR